MMFLSKILKTPKTWIENMIDDWRSSHDPRWVADGRRHVLFVCSGNTCRSPMAMAFLRYFLQNDERVRVESAGTSAYYAHKMSDDAEKSLKIFGVPVPDHKSTKLTKTIVDWADVVYVMSGWGINEIVRMNPNKPVYVLNDPDGIDDPYGGKMGEYMWTANTIRKAVQPEAAFILNVVENDLSFEVESTFPAVEKELDEEYDPSMDQRNPTPKEILATDEFWKKVEAAKKNDDWDKYAEETDEMWP